MTSRLEHTGIIRRVRRVAELHGQTEIASALQVAEATGKFPDIKIDVPIPS